VVDPTAEEETCSNASMVIAVTEKSLVTSAFKTGVGSFHPQTLVEILKVCLLK
jgi:exosome complex RNA-binding protein Rrp42 (RNase PH superfamily)